MRNIQDSVPAKDDGPLTVSALTARLRGTLEANFARVHVSGEISGWNLAASGHAYFTIKDDGAALSCVLWKSSRVSLSFRPADGMQVECRGAISVFEKRGQYQLTVSRMTQAGQGALWRKFEELKARLEAEGLFDPAVKRSIPRYPSGIGVVTSPGGAVIHDIRNVLRRRAPWVPVYLWPVRVQGDGAAKEISRGIAELAATGLVDVLIVGRGGGSLEDLWEFNSEAVARAVRACPVPVVSAVGHETDFTICDFAADLRAPTPSAAAELVSEHHYQLLARLEDARRRLERDVVHRLRETRQRVEGLQRSYGMRRPELMLRDLQQRVDLAQQRMPERLQRRLERIRARVTALTKGLAGHNPELILEKGYAIVREKKSGRILSDAATIYPGTHLTMQLSRGELGAVVTGEARQPDLFEE